MMEYTTTASKPASTEPGFTDIEKTILTVAVVFSVLIIGASFSICWWCYSLSKKRKKSFEKEKYKMESIHRSTDDIVEDLRRLSTSESPHQGQIPQTEEHKQIESQSSEPNRAPANADERSTPTFSIPRSTIPHMFASKYNNKYGRESNSDMTTFSSTDSTVSSVSIDESEQNISRSELSLIPVTHISRADYASRALVNPSYVRDSGLLWPDVVDPYHRSAMLEMQIGGRALDVHNRSSLETAIHRLHYNH